MRRFRRSSFTRSFVLPFALTLWLGACHSWVPARLPSVELPAQAALPTGDRDELRLHVGEETQMEGVLADLTADSVTISGEDSTATVSVEEITRVEVRKADTAKTVFLGLGIAAAAFGILVGVALLANEADLAGYCSEDRKDAPGHRAGKWSAAPDMAATVAVRGVAV